MSRKLIWLLSFTVMLGLAGNASGVEGWWNQDIQTTAGSATEKDGVFTVIGDGSDIWGAADGFHYVYKKLDGDGSMTARVVSQQNTNEWAKAGVMIRETLTPGSKHCFMAMTPTAAQGVAFQNRTETDSGTCYSAHYNPSMIDPAMQYGYPFWVRIEREGDEISGYVSADGVDWKLVPPGTGGDASPNPQTNEMADVVYIGLAVTSHAAGSLSQVEFDNVSYTGDIIDRTPQLKAFDPDPADGTIGVGMPLLQWSKGETALLHDIYVGTGPELTAADQVGARLPTTLYYHAPGFLAGTTYYWRVDEIEKDGVTIHTGDVWSFVTQDLTAYYPIPANKANDVSLAPTLTWMPGVGAVKHQLYFSDSLDAVTQAAAEADKGSFEAVDTAFAPGDLEPLTTYYWRVDETVGADIKAGPVWSFITCLPVDDFESYTNDEGSRIYETWVDGFTNDQSGSIIGYFNTPFAEQTIVRGGMQSMPFEYNNIEPPFYSEGEREFGSAQDWTVAGADTLVLFVRGVKKNPPALLYVGLEDTAGQAGFVYHTDPELVSAREWTEWKISLSEFTPANPAAIEKLYLGVGDKANPAAGGTGIIYIDDIYVTRPPAAE